MFSVKKINRIYNKIYFKINESFWLDRLITNPYSLRVDYTRGHSLTEQQWQSLVDVCYVIQQNFSKFDMRNFHAVDECGTVHCIAGWTEALAMNDPSLTYDNCDRVVRNEVCRKYGVSSNSIADLAEGILSRFIEPFFYLYQHKDAEQIMLEDFIIPVLKEARKDGTIVSDSVHKFAMRAWVGKTETV